MLGQLRTLCLGKYILVAPAVWHGIYRVLEDMLRILDHFAIGRPRHLDYLPYRVHNYKDIGRTAPLRRQDGIRLTPANTPSAGLAGTRRGSPPSAGCDRCRSFATARSSTRTIWCRSSTRCCAASRRRAAQWWMRPSPLGFPGRSSTSHRICSIARVCPALLPRKRGPKRAPQAHRRSARDPGASGARGRADAQWRAIWRRFWRSAAASVHIPAVSFGGCFPI